MCGITGFIDFSKSAKDKNFKILNAMTEAIKYRGPDDSGNWCNLKSDVFLGHRRLAILDLSKSGAQPMVSENNRYIIIFNGEIYNHQEIRKLITKDIPNIQWTSSSDTQTLLVAFELWGIEESVKKCRGMFAIAVWDNKEDILYLIRDRFGEKPLYYGFQKNNSENVFLFGSQLSSLKKHPSFKSKISRKSLSLYMKYGNVPGVHSIYEGINKLEPGSVLEFHKSSKRMRTYKYWSSAESINKNQLKRFDGSEDDAVRKLESLLTDTIEMQMISDVPIGAFLSSGIDSSTIVSLMQKVSSNPVKTFTIGFEEETYNEAPYAKEIANHLGTSHHELYISTKDVLEEIRKIPEIYDEPFADQSQIPTYLVCKMARDKVKVALSGDAGDELFGGYNRHRFVLNTYSKFKNLSPNIKKLISVMLKQISPTSWDIILQASPYKNSWQDFGSKIHKFAQVIDAHNDKNLYFKLISCTDDINEILKGDYFEDDDYITEINDEFKNLRPVEKIMAYDVLAYLPDDILTKVDRAAMAVSLETRVPFLDQKISAFAWSLPINLKTRNRNNKYTSKWILREILKKHIPSDFFNRPKMGFGMPIAAWLRGPLKCWAEELINENRINEDGYFNYNYVNQIWHEHQSGKKNNQKILWNLLMFQLWLDYQ